MINLNLKKRELYCILLWSLFFLRQKYWNGVRTIQRKLAKIGTYIVIFVAVFLTLMFVKAWIDGKFNSVETLQDYMDRFGIFAPIFLTVFQAIQVVLPVLPGFLGCFAGSLMFGPLVGFLCNYIGISLGSLIAFMLARKYGSKLIDALFDPKKYKRWADMAARSKSYAWFIFVATIIPLFPDDYLCYLSGLTKMSFKKFFWIIIIGKPWCILAYSLGFSLIK